MPSAPNRSGHTAGVLGTVGAAPQTGVPILQLHVQSL